MFLSAAAEEEESVAMAAEAEGGSLAQAGLELELEFAAGEASRRRGKKKMNSSRSINEERTRRHASSASFCTLLCVFGPRAPSPLLFLLGLSTPTWASIFIHWAHPYIFWPILVAGLFTFVSSLGAIKVLPHWFPFEKRRKRKKKKQVCTSRSRLVAPSASHASCLMFPIQQVINQSNNKAKY